MLTVWEHLVFVARSCRLRDGWEEEAARLVDRLGIADQRDTLGEALSKGMRQKLLLACGVLAATPVLLLDEPMIGLDPRGQRELRDLLVELRRRVRAIARDPKRLIPWLIFLAWFGLQVPLRLAIGSSRRTPRLPGVLLAGAASLAPGVYLVIAGLVLRAACRRAPAPFSSPADARFLIGSAIPPRLVMLWLQLRALRGQAWRWSAAVVIYFVALPTLTPNLGQAATTMVALALAASFLLGLRLPLFLVARRNPRLPLVYLTDLVTLAGVVSLAAAVARLLNYEVPRLDLPPGSVLVAAIGGDLAALALLFALALGAGALSIALSGDTYPELWETSVRSFTLRRWLRSGEMPSRGDLRRARQDAGLQTRTRTTVASDRGTHVPSGAWTQLWKEWLGVRRGLPGGDVTLLLIVR